MDKMEFDRTRKAIKADKLKDKDRREMLEKLSDAGGQVMKERAVHPVTGEPEKGEKGRSEKKYEMPGEARLPSEIARERSREEQDRQAMIRKYREQMEREASSFTARLIVKLKCALKGIAPFGRNVVRPEFMSLLNLDLKRAVMECHIMGNDLLASDPNIAKKIVKELDQRQPIYAELIERASTLYNRTTLNNLTAFYSANPDMEVPFSEIRSPLLTMLRSLYYMKPFQESYLTAVDTAIGIQQLLEKKQDNLYIAKKKKIRKEWDNLMNTIFPQMVLLMQRVELKQAEPFTDIFDHILDVKFDEKPGKRRAGDPVGAAAVEKKEPEKPVEAEKSEPPVEAVPKEIALLPEVEYGRRLLMLYRPDRLRKDFDQRGDWNLLSIRDKVLLSYLFMRLFETDYSFVLTSPKIQINSFYRGGTRIDIKRSMSVILERGHACHDAFRKYLMEAIEYFRVSTTNAPPGGYVEHQKLLTMLEGRRGTSGQQVKGMIADFMNRVVEALRSLVEDIGGARQIVVNTDEIYTFDLTSDITKRLNGRAVKICIWEAFCFAAALAHEIEAGSLYGGVIEMSEEEFFTSFPVETPEPDPSLIPYRTNHIELDEKD